MAKARPKIANLHANDAGDPPIDVSNPTSNFRQFEKRKAAYKKIGQAIIDEWTNVQNNLAMGNVVPMDREALEKKIAAALRLKATPGDPFGDPAGNVEIGVICDPPPDPNGTKFVWIVIPYPESPTGNIADSIARYNSTQDDAAALLGESILFGCGR